MAAAAATIPDVIDPVVPFYGRQVPADFVPNIDVPFLLQYAENDKRVNASWPD